MSERRALAHSVLMEPYRYRVSWEEHLELVGEIESDGSSPLLVSVDWDFFLPPPDLASFPDERAEILAAGSRYALEEFFSHERQMAVWRDNAQRMALAGVDAADAFQVRGSLEEFSLRLKRAFTFEECLIADSHAWGVHAALRASRRSAQPVSVISFDAHHDCGYFNYAGDNWRRSQARAFERPSCDDWIHSSLVHGVVSEAQIVYPDWCDEWEIQPNTLPDEFYHRVRPTHWSEWQEPQSQKATLLLVRSSAYSPPYGDLDAQFLRLARLMGDFHCLDCDPPGGMRIGDNNACKERSI